MAPYGGPSLAKLVALFEKGLPDQVALGFGIPAATVGRDGDAFELRALSGGLGFGVSAELVTPFADAGVLARSARWQDVIEWLVEHWEERFGEPFQKSEAVRVRFAAENGRALAMALRRELEWPIHAAIASVEQGLLTKDLKLAASVCRVARAEGAQLDFEAVLVTLRFDVVLHACPPPLAPSLDTERRLLLRNLGAHAGLSRSEAEALLQSLPAVVYSSATRHEANEVLANLSVGPGVRLDLVEGCEPV